MFKRLLFGAVLGASLIACTPASPGSTVAPASVAPAESMPAESMPAESMPAESMPAESASPSAS